MLFNGFHDDLKAGSRPIAASYRPCHTFRSFAILTPATQAHAYVCQRTVILAIKVNIDRPRAVVAGDL
jgi:hypothetical protein